MPSPAETRNAAPPEGVAGASVAAAVAPGPPATVPASPFDGNIIAAPPRPPSRLAGEAAALVGRYVSGDSLTSPARPDGLQGMDSFRRIRSPSGAASAAPVSPSAAATAREAAAASLIQAAYRAHARRMARARPFSRLGAAAAALVERYVAGGDAAAAPAAERFPTAARLVLHFDVNKTIVMTDAAQGAGVGCVRGGGWGVAAGAPAPVAPVRGPHPATPTSCTQLHRQYAPVRVRVGSPRARPRVGARRPPCVRPAGG